MTAELSLLRLQNFQAHKDLTIEFGKITSITGPSDSGKSSILRALKWVLTNKPGGVGFIKDGEHTATVTLEIDGKVIKRTRRGSSKNLYHMDEDEYVAFGNDVPRPIVEVVNINELNFQEQHDAPFWFTVSAGDLAKRLNQIVDLSQIDTTLSNIDSSSRKIAMEVKILEERKVELKAKRVALKWTKEASQDLEEMDKIEKRVQRRDIEGASLDVLISAIQAYDEGHESAVQLLSLGETAGLWGEKWWRIRGEVISLEDYVGTLEGLDVELNQPEPPSLEPLEKLVLIIEEQAEERFQLEAWIDRLEGLEECNEEELEKLQKRLKKEIGKECPLCETPIK